MFDSLLVPHCTTYYPFKVTTKILIIKLTTRREGFALAERILPAKNKITWERIEKKIQINKTETRRIQNLLTLKNANENVLFLFLRSVVFCALPSLINHFWIHILCFVLFSFSAHRIRINRISLTSHNIRADSTTHSPMLCAIFSMRSKQPPTLTTTAAATPAAADNVHVIHYQKYRPEVWYTVRKMTAILVIAHRSIWPMVDVDDKWLNRKS